MFVSLVDIRGRNDRKLDEEIETTLVLIGYIFYHGRNDRKLDEEIETRKSQQWLIKRFKVGMTVSSMRRLKPNNEPMSAFWAIVGMTVSSMRRLKLFLFLLTLSRHYVGMTVSSMRRLKLL